MIASAAAWIWPVETSTVCGRQKACQNDHDTSMSLLDMIRYHKFLIARLWISEYGCADKPEQFKWLMGYSPYQNVKEGVAYPAVLLEAAESDGRVDALHARKMAARLQSATSSDQPVLLRLETKAGHGQGKPRGKVLDELTDTWSFVFWQLGIGG